MIEILNIDELKGRGEDIDVLLWVGCAGSFDERSQKISLAVSKILNHCGIKFAILGKKEGCTGDVAKRSGNEFLFQMQAQKNIDTFKEYDIKTILTFCPHCFNTFINEYPELGADEIKVFHHTIYIENLISEGKIEIEKEAEMGSVVFHDPCYLGRGNGIYDAPRNVLEKVSGDIIEAKNSKKNSFCCGAGGGQIFKEAEPGKEEVNHKRSKELQDSGAKTIATGCPFCKIMIDDGIKNITNGAEKKVAVKDISEIVCDSLNL